MLTTGGVDMPKIQAGKLRALLKAVEDGGAMSLWPDLAVNAIAALPVLLDIYEHKRLTIYQQIDSERTRQHEDLDDTRPRAAWASLIKEHVTRATRAGNDGDADEWRHRMIVIASLAVAAIEAHDRKRASEPVLMVDPVCGSQGVDDEGRCIRCGLCPGDDQQCPPGFLTTDGGKAPGQPK